MLIGRGVGRWGGGGGQREERWSQHICIQKHARARVCVCVCVRACVRHVSLDCIFDYF